MSLHIYLPQDRLRALARGETLPDRTKGAALFADISGFTTLTEALHNELGPRRGVEELTRRMESIYSAMIHEIERHGGSVISFAGDSMLCWFDDAGIGEQRVGDEQSSAALAVACGLSLQRVIQMQDKLTLPDQSTIPFALKVAVASGAARRFVVGDPDVGWIDVLAGATVTRTAVAENLARKGELMIDETTVRSFNDVLTIEDWRRYADSGERFALVAALTKPVEPAIRSSLDLESLLPEGLRPWLHPLLFEREQTGRDSFLTEFRPCVTMFVRFTGIDFDSNEAGSQLNMFVENAQQTAARHGGMLLDITIGDKGSYIYINFGALSTHEDDARRAVGAALELRNTAKQLDFLQPLQIGITQGILRVGAYGGQTRKTFGALGDEVNLAARLMMTAAPGETLVSSRVHKAVEKFFVFEPRPPLPMKGKAEPLPVFAVTSERKQRAIRLQEPTYDLPMVGRQNELRIINDKLDLVAKGQGQVIGIVAEAGLGKSRLVAEVIRSARRKGFIGFGGACQSDGMHTPYLAWKSIWQAFFDVDADVPLRKQMRNIEGEIEDRTPDRVEAVPLLNVVLDLNIPENDFTKNLEPKIRQSALHALLEDCLKSAARDEPTLIVIEDLHWIDALSHDLLEGLAKALANYAVCFLLAYRPPQMERLQAPRLEALPQFTRVELHELSKAEAESAIRAKLLQLYPARSGALPNGLVDVLMRRAQGNPFYLEELLNYIRDRGLDPSDLGRIELPDSLHTLILSRIDQLSEQEKTTLRVASIIGRLFHARWLTGYYPELGSFPQVKADLDALESLDITPLDSPEPELTYLFKHIVTHEVTYESLPFATRAKLHEQLARFLESIDAPLDAIAFHYGRSENKEKQREYLRKAGEVAQRDFANDAALEYYGMLLPLLEDANAHAQTEVHLKRGEVLELMGKWDEAERDYHLALNFAQDDLALKASAQIALGKLSTQRGDHDSALAWLAQAQEACKTLEDMVGLAQALIETGYILYRKMEFVQARELSSEGLALARQAGDRLKISKALNVLGNMATEQGDYSTARALHEESLAVRRAVGDKVGIAGSLRNLGLVASSQGDYAKARVLLEESLALNHEMGAKAGIADLLVYVGAIAFVQGDYPAARALWEECLELNREIGDKPLTAMTLDNLGAIAFVQGDYSAARALFEKSLKLSREIGYKRLAVVVLDDLGLMAFAQGDYPVARTLYEESLALWKELPERTFMTDTLLYQGLLDLAEGKPEARKKILPSLRHYQEMGERFMQTFSLLGAAGLALKEGNPLFAAQLLGAVNSGLLVLHISMHPFLVPFHQETLAVAREQLGESAFQSAWEEGSQWSLEEAVEKALDE